VSREHKVFKVLPVELVEQDLKVFKVLRVFKDLKVSRVLKVLPAERD
jgi:hypothetical protein